MQPAPNLRSWLHATSRPPDHRVQTLAVVGTQHTSILQLALDLQRKCALNGSAARLMHRHCLPTSF